MITHLLRTKQPRAKRQDFPLNGVTFFRLLARRTPPGGRPRGWATVTCALPSSLQCSFRRGSLHQQSVYQMLKSCLFFLISNTFLKMFVFLPRRLRYRMKMGSVSAPISPKAPTCKHYLLYTSANVLDS